MPPQPRPGRVSSKAPPTRPGLPSRSAASIMLVMDRGKQAGGKTKCRKFTNLADVHQSMLVISTIMAGHYCVPKPCLVTDAAITGDRIAASRAGTTRYWPLAIWHRLVQHGLPGL